MKRNLNYIVLAIFVFFTVVSLWEVPAYAKDEINVGIQYDPATLNALEVKAELDI
ncbi:MAG: hypothetical protein JRJ76_05150, partial [Deltaproteobacteria bacterium]|nr:hypothetical protein [Deltaproteobacteria bacterium]